MEAGREMDALVAEKVMGWTRRGEILIPPMKPGMAACVPGFPFYSTDISAAWEVVEKLPWSIADGVEFTVQRTYGSWFAGYWDRDAGRCRVSELGRTAPHAICLSALKAVGAR